MFLFLVELGTILLLLAAELSNTSYWRAPFLPFTGTKQLAEFTVIDVELNRDTIKSKVRV